MLRNKINSKVLSR